MKLILTIIVYIICALGASAQENYYEYTKTFNENGYTYQCDVQDSRLVILYNKKNKYTYVDQILRNTGEPISIKEHKQEFEEETWTRPKCFSIVNNAFSSLEKTRIKGLKFTIVMYVNPDSGEVSEVMFRFGSFQPYATIPVSVYRKIEIELKKNIRFVPTAEGKKLNYILIGWRQEPE